MWNSAAGYYSRDESGFKNQHYWLSVIEFDDCYRTIKFIDVNECKIFIKEQNELIDSIGISCYRNIVDSILGIVK